MKQKKTMKLVSNSLPTLSRSMKITQKALLTRLQSNLPFAATLGTKYGCELFNTGVVRLEKGSKTVKHHRGGRVLQLCLLLSVLDSHMEISC